MYAPLARSKCSAQPRRARDPIIAAIIGSDNVAALGITVRSSSPLLCLCRVLLDAGADPDQPLHAFRGDALALTIRDTFP